MALRGIHDRSWQWSAAICTLLLVVPIWVTDLLPLADAPQHAAQLAIGIHWPGIGFPYSRHFEHNWLANSIVPYALSYLFAQVVPVVVALKLVLCVALVGLPLATLRLIQTLDGDRWWVFASFPVAYGYALMWGFIPFVFAAPIGLLLIDTAIRYRTAPTRRLAWAMAGLVFLLFGCHVLVLAYAGLAASLVVASLPTRRVRLVGLFSLASVLPLVAAWWVATKLLTPDTTPLSAPIRLEYGVGRVPGLFGYMVGAQDIAYLNVFHGLLLTTVPLLVGARAARPWWRYAPLGAAVVLHFTMPLNWLDTAFLYPRFTLFVIPGLLIALDSTPRRHLLGPAAAVALAVASLALVVERFLAFELEARAPAALVKALEPNKRLLALIAEPRSSAVPGFPYLNFGCWYTALRGGIADFSFAEFYPNRFRYRPGMDPPLPYNVEWSPELFVWSAHGGAMYDYFLVRGATLDPFRGATTPIELVARKGEWSVYRQRPHVQPVTVRESDRR
jgi:hypothetical protein